MAHCYYDYGFRALEKCPWYRPLSNGCHQTMCPLHKQEKAMQDEFHYIAIGLNQNNSGPCKTMEEAERWAAIYFISNPSVGKIFIYVSKVVVERGPPRTRELYRS